MTSDSELSQSSNFQDTLRTIDEATSRISASNILFAQENIESAVNMIFDDALPSLITGSSNIDLQSTVVNNQGTLNSNRNDAQNTNTSLRAEIKNINTNLRTDINTKFDSLSRNLTLVTQDIKKIKQEQKQVLNDFQDTVTQQISDLTKNFPKEMNVKFEDMEKQLKQDVLSEIHNDITEIKQKLHTLNERNDTVEQQTKGIKDTHTNLETTQIQLTSTVKNIPTVVNKLSKDYENIPAAIGELTLKVASLEIESVCAKKERDKINENLSDVISQPEAGTLDKTSTAAEKVVKECKLMNDIVEKSIQQKENDIIDKVSTNLQARENRIRNYLGETDTETQVVHINKVPTTANQSNVCTQTIHCKLYK
ncbi:uncharacterized protein LOC126155835 [Schistocerca cancellata]|uniref:uncharacterized protein LOC126155835 n=1 Tax=Schistocerca cancellata TaxID=274614 RepID=UPI002117F1FC|nr:uncharacterized protein LOC126155835 [Schistocerca cancellata]